MMRRGVAPIVVLLAGCGGGSAGVTTPTAPLVPLTAPRLPAGWTRVSAGTLSFGIPPGWRATASGLVVQVRSSDRALALTVALDSRAGAVTTPAYATATLNALAGYSGLTRSVARPIVDTQYAAASISATGTLRSTGVRQRIVAIALAPAPRTICSLLAFSSARVPRTRYVAALTALVRTVYVARSGRSG